MAKSVSIEQGRIRRRRHVEKKAEGGRRESATERQRHHLPRMLRERTEKKRVESNSGIQHRCP